jgi:hypothetical protein
MKRGAKAMSLLLVLPALGAYVHNDSLPLGARDINLLGGGDVQVPQIGLQLSIGSLEVEEGLHTVKHG